MPSSSITIALHFYGFIFILYMYCCWILLLQICWFAVGNAITIKVSAWVIRGCKRSQDGVHFAICCSPEQDAGIMNRGANYATAIPSSFNVPGLYTAGRLTRAEAILTKPDLHHTVTCAYLYLPWWFCVLHFCCFLLLGKQS